MDYQKYRPLPDLVAARQLAEHEEFQSDLYGGMAQGEAGDWVVSTGMNLLVFSDEEFRRDYDPEAHPEDQGRDIAGQDGLAIPPTIEYPPDEYHTEADAPGPQPLPAQMEREIAGGFDADGFPKDKTYLQDVQPDDVLEAP